MVAPACASWAALSGACVVAVLWLGGLEAAALVAVVVAAVVQLHGVLRAAGEPRADADGPDASILRVDLAARGRGR
ncbi:MAG: hypothetical protein K8W52_21530 [Deltaproteobacteria bacterium]|nr:hypothetical protein [Deltaproteobacteria bacterium]